VCVSEWICGFVGVVRVCGCLVVCVLVGAYL